MLPQHTYGVVQLELGNGIGAGEDDGGGGFNLVVIELAEVLRIHLDLAGIHHRHGIAQGDIVGGDLVHSADDIGQLAHAGGLNNDPVGGILANHLLQGLAEVAHQGAANAAGVHFGDVDTGILQEAAVDADFAKFVFNQHQLLALVALGNHLFNQCGFTCTQETGININFGHKKCLFSKFSLPVIISPPVNRYKKFSPAIFYRTVNFAGKKPAPPGHRLRAIGKFCPGAVPSEFFAEWGWQTGR